MIVRVGAENPVIGNKQSGKFAACEVVFRKYQNNSSYMHIQTMSVY